MLDPVGMWREGRKGGEGREEQEDGGGRKSRKGEREVEGRGVWGEGEREER